ncbi:hypothetical protein F442_08527 [Phytophthora nicotianae P10297]|uniref:Uncharacterized protein n=1 Tax=Phytophthora nicotianae P10297 TaxID=1317064 RepID=W2ZD77_PHYNI|nr:hypothetical protein F442_08527 [Phytophthora nicotianae P10297]
MIDPFVGTHLCLQRFPAGPVSGSYPFLSTQMWFGYCHVIASVSVFRNSNAVTICPGDSPAAGKLRMNGGD